MLPAPAGADTAGALEATTGERHVGRAERRAEDGHALVEHDLERVVDQIRDGIRSLGLGGNAQPLAELVEGTLGAAQRPVRDRRGIGRRTQLAVKPEVDPERPVGQLADSTNALAQLVGRDVQPRENPERPGPADLGHQLRPRDPAHSGLQDRIFDAEQVAERGAEHLGHSAR